MGHLVLAGGGHAHLMTLASISTIVGQGHRVTVVAPSPFHYYSGMGPGMLGGTYGAEEIRFATQKVVEQQGGRFLLDRVSRIAAQERTIRLASGQEIAYDVLSCNTGSQVTTDLNPAGAADIFPVKPIERLAEARDRVLTLAGQGPVTIAIVGGGPTSADIAGNLRQLTSRPGLQPARIMIYAGHAMMGHFPEGVRSRVIAALVARGV